MINISIIFKPVPTFDWLIEHHICEPALESLKHWGWQTDKLTVKRWHDQSWKNSFQFCQDRKRQVIFLEMLSVVVFQAPKTKTPRCHRDPRFKKWTCVFSGMRQGNDVGTTYRSAIYAYTQQQLEEALASKDQYQKVNRSTSLCYLNNLCTKAFRFLRDPLLVEHFGLIKL